MKRLVSVILSIIMVLAAMQPHFLGKADAASKPSYKIEISQKRNVAVVYKKTGGKWKYSRTMLCSVGLGTKTPNGTFHLGAKHRWGYLVGNCWGQYCAVISGDIWFHSVWYHHKNKHSLSAKEYAKLGRKASHGCVRLAVIDAKWIYENCKRGTTVRIAPDVKMPKGKPQRVGSAKNGWDPTDPDKKNPNFKLKKAIIAAKGKKVIWKSKYSVMSGVSAYNPNALEYLTDRVKAQVLIGGKWKTVKRLPTTKTGKVKVKYSVAYPYCRDASKIVTFTVADNSKPVIAAKNRSVEIGENNAVKYATAKQKDGTDRTRAIRVTITDPQGDIAAEDITYDDAVSFVFEKSGKYTVELKVANRDYAKKISVKRVTISVKEQQPV